MRLVCLETSSPTGSVALAEFDGKSYQIVAEASWSRGKSHSELATLHVEECLRRAGWQLKELDGIALGLGPGSFTGIRVGINIARALGYALNIPLYPVNSLRILAQAQLQAEGPPVLALVNAFKNLVFTALFQEQAGTVLELVATQALSPEQVEQLIVQEVRVVGDGWAAYAPLWSEAFRERCNITATTQPLAHMLPQILAQSSPDVTKLNWKDVKPLYIRASAAEEKLQSGLLKPLPKV